MVYPGSLPAATMVNDNNTPAWRPELLDDENQFPDKD